MKKRAFSLASKLRAFGSGGKGKHKQSLLMRGLDLECSALMMLAKPNPVYEEALVSANGHYFSAKLNTGMRAASCYAVHTRPTASKL